MCALSVCMCIAIKPFLPTQCSVLASGQENLTQDNIVSFVLEQINTTRHTVNKLTFCAISPLDTSKLNYVLSETKPMQCKNNETMRITLISDLVD